MHNSILAAFIFLSCICYSVQQPQVKVTLYYEALCPYCHEFIEGQLYPGYQQVKDSVILDLVPFGHAYSNKTDNGITWTCQHGPLECYLNKVDACVINLTPNQSQILSFVYCTTIGSSSDKTQKETYTLAKQCARDNKISWDDISTCLNDGTADNLLLAYEDRQNKLDTKIDYVPNIRFNDTYDENLENIATFDFIYAVCHSLQSNKPSACKGKLKSLLNMHKPKKC